MLFDTTNMFCSSNMHRAGLKKRFLSIDDDNEVITFCYCEKGSKVPQQPSIVFIHGFSSNKYTWSSVIKVSHYLLLCKGKCLLIHRIFLIIFTVSQLICLVMEKPLDLVKNTSQQLTWLINLNWYCMI